MKLIQRFHKKKTRPPSQKQRFKYSSSKKSFSLLLSFFNILTFLLIFGSVKFVQAQAVQTCTSNNGCASGMICHVLTKTCTKPFTSAGHYSNWIFGKNCRVSWDANGKATVGKPPAQFNTKEGSSTYSNPVTGGLILYTDGQNAWNSKGRRINKGHLGGHPSGMHSGIIFSSPSEPGQFYLFANSYERRGNIRYTKFDMRISPGRQVGGTKTLISNTNESQQVIPHSNGRDYWHLSSRDSKIYVTAITNKGVGTPKATILAGNYTPYWWGPFRTSSSGRKVAMSRSFGAKNTGGSYPLITIDFDPSTGTLSNITSVVKLHTGFIYEAEFSRDETKLYLTYSGVSTLKSSWIYQLDLKTKKLTLLATLTTDTIGSLRLAPDGKIYITSNGKGYLHTIEKPNVAGKACGFKLNALKLAPGCIAFYGLPTGPATFSKLPPVTCGNGYLDPGEQCDDKNQNNNDGCSSSCKVEKGYICTGGSPTSISICKKINRPPTITRTPIAVVIGGQKYGFKPGVTDPDQGQIHTWRGTNLPSGATVNSQTGEVTWNPSLSQAGKTYIFEIEVCDNGSPRKCAKKHWKVRVIRPQACTKNKDCLAGMVCHVLTKTCTKPFTSAGHYADWIFGRNCRVSWDANQRVTVGNPPAPFYTKEGCSTYSNPVTGGLILYTDGRTAWNHKGKVISKGNLGGHPSGMHSGIIFPSPSEPGQFYIFANGLERNSIRYTKFDMRISPGKQVGGTKALISNTNESQQVIPHSNGRDYWHLSSRDSKIYVTAITNKGVGTPKATTLAGNYTPYWWGPFRTSSSGRKIAMSRSFGAGDTGGSYPLITIDFDPSTGTLSNTTSVVKLHTGFIYEAEFSRDETKLYLSYAGVSKLKFSWIYQLDLKTKKLTLLAQVTANSIGSLRLAPDGKIYITSNGKGYLHVIEKPNVAGTACKFRANSLKLAPGCTAYFGLPTGPATFSKLPPITCGNGYLDLGEQCDDKNQNNNDGCSAFCKVEKGYTCKGGSPTSVSICKNTNQPPTIIGTPAAIISNGQKYRFRPSVTQPGKGRVYIWRGINLPAGAKVNTQTGEVTWTPSSSQAGKTYSFEIEVCSDEKPKKCARTSWKVKVNLSLRVIGTPLKTATPEKLYQTVLGALNGVPPYSYTFSKAPKGASIDFRTGNLSWKPKLSDASKTFTFTVKVCDSGKSKQCKVKTWMVKTSAGNHSPVITGTPSSRASENKKYTFQPSIKDLDKGQKYTWTKVKLPQGATLDPKTGEVQWTPKASDISKTFDFEIKVCDNGSPKKCATKKWNVKVATTNASPKITSKPPIKAYTNQKYKYKATAQDPNQNDKLSWKLLKGPTGSQIDKKTGELTWTPSVRDANKEIAFEIEVCDDATPSKCARQKFKVKPKNLNFCKTDSNCPKNLICLEGRCTNSGCYKKKCGKGQVCSESKCVENPCGSANCMEDEVCRPSDGKCIKICPTCPSTQVCKDGKCTADVCQNTECKKDEKCINGSCEKAPCGTKGSKFCRYERVCKSEKGLKSCTDNLCKNVICPNKGTCKAGICYSNKSIEEGETNPDKEGKTNSDKEGKTNPDKDGGTNPDKENNDMNALGEVGCACSANNSQRPFGILFLSILFLAMPFLRRRK